MSRLTNVVYKGNGTAFNLRNQGCPDTYNQNEPGGHSVK